MTYQILRYNVLFAIFAHSIRNLRILAIASICLHSGLCRGAARRHIADMQPSSTTFGLQSGGSLAGPTYM